MKGMAHGGPCGPFSSPLGSFIMALAAPPTATSWTAADLVERFGAIPLCRLRLEPAPGTAGEHDVVEIHDREDRLYELVDGTLLEKAVGTYESYLAMLLGRLLGNFASEHDLGIVLGADGMLRLGAGLVRIPDVSFIGWERLPGETVPRQAIAEIVPHLAVEVISKGNTAEEMDRKLDDYLGAGVRQVWYVDPPAGEIRVYRGGGDCRTLTREDTLEGADILPGFTLALDKFFAEPRGKQKGKD